jgi:carbamoyl-phosphate synthase large subunit
MPRRVLVIGSGPILIGQAAEFDYAGVQACLALRAQGVETILVNSNPATVMTDPDVGGIVIIGPLTLAHVTRVIEEHRPDALLPTLGGQTGLNLAVALDDAGVLAKHGVRVLGTPLAAVRAAEDRGGFRDLVTGIGEPVPESAVVESLDDGMRFFEHLRAPIVVRPAFTLGGGGGGFAHTAQEARDRIAAGLAASPIGQVLVERSLTGWYEIEFEVLRDASDTTIAICGMENLDPMGVHTGDSIVVAPIQTLPDPVVQRLRRCALKIVRALKLEGGCNVQLAVSPDGVDYRVIEVNPRVSRSSALASKATGYPIARIAALIALGHRLHEMPNPATGGNSAAFEPAVDYVVVKLPRWPFDKFPLADRSLGIQMKATRRGHGHRSRVRFRPAQGHPLPGAARTRLAVGGPGMGADLSGSGRPRRLSGADRYAAVADDRPPAPWLDRCRRDRGGDRDCALVPRPSCRAGQRRARGGGCAAARREAHRLR